MKNQVINSCLVKPSQVGAKGFFYPDESSDPVLIKRGTEVEKLSYVSTSKYADWQAIAVPNNLVEGSFSSDGVGVYWIPSKNLGE